MASAPHPQPFPAIDFLARPVSARAGGARPGAGEPAAGQLRRPQRPLPARAEHRGARPNLPVLFGLALLHALLLGAILTHRFPVDVPPPPAALASYAVEEAPPPPPPPPPPAPVEVALPEVAAPAVILAPEPPAERPRAPSPVTAAPAVSPEPVAATADEEAEPGPPAPVVPPDFAASQLNNPGPTYPYLSRRHREEGVVTLRVLVSEEGAARELSVEESSGFERLDRAALACVRRWKFVPAKQGGREVAAWVLVPITFALG